MNGSLRGPRPLQKEYFWQKYSCGAVNSGTAAPADEPAGSVRYFINYPFVYQNWAKERGFLPTPDCRPLPPENLPAAAADLPPLQIVSPRLAGDSYFR